MDFIGITGQTGVGKTLLTNKFEGNDTVIVDVDKISREAFKNDVALQQTINYLYEKCGSNTIQSSFWEMLMSSRKDCQQLEDPLWREIERQIDLIINSANAQRIVFDYALLPKTKYFDLCNYNILLLPSSDELRKQAVVKRDNLASTERLDRRDRYSLDYRGYKFDRIVINTYDENQFSDLKDTVLQELENGNTERKGSAEPKEI